ncbi:MAG: hypothetical protein JWP12_3513 [Bacteroidetes bacterium]|nr:hypothetical protein [Bacteroidota bacterium]
MLSNNNYKNKKHKGFKPFVLLLWLISSAGYTFSQTQQYELNDPRNPDCPCHKAQKQAEQEYAQLNPPKNNVPVEPEINPPLLQKNVETTTHNVVSVSTKNKHKNKTGWIRKSMFRYFRKHRGIKKMHTDYSVCFHNW